MSRKLNEKPQPLASYSINAHFRWTLHWPRFTVRNVFTLNYPWPTVSPDRIDRWWNAPGDEDAVTSITVIHLTWTISMHISWLDFVLIFFPFSHWCWLRKLPVNNSGLECTSCRRSSVASVTLKNMQINGMALHSEYQNGFRAANVSLCLPHCHRPDGRNRTDALTQKRRNLNFFVINSIVVCFEYTTSVGISKALPSVFVIVIVLLIVVIVIYTVIVVVGVRLAQINFNGSKWNAIFFYFSVKGLWFANDKFLSVSGVFRSNDDDLFRHGSWWYSVSMTRHWNLTGNWMEIGLNWFLLECAPNLNGPKRVDECH